MPDYRRLVSYIYNYEDGKKKNNVGYARIEARNGLCKCTLHITAPSLNDKQLKVYFFRRDNGGLNGIQIGIMSIRNGVGDLKVQTNSAHIMNSPYGVEHMGGLVLYLSDSKFFATEWDDQPINMEVVSTLERKETVKAAGKETESAIKEKESDLVETNSKMEKEDFEGKKEVGAEIYNIKQDVKAEIHNIKQDAETEAYYVKQDPGTKRSEVKIETESLKEKKEEPPVFGIKKESQPVIPKVKSTKEIDKDLVSAENLIKLATVITEQMNLKPGTPEQQVSPEPKPVVSNQPAAEDKREDTNSTIRNATPVTLTEAHCTPGRDPERDKWEDEMTRKYYEKERTEDNIPDNRGREEQDRREKLTKPFFEDHPTAQYMYNNFQRMYPFEDNEVAWCVKIEPQDIGLLPMESWVLGNNSFLLHGYYSYRHLIFARVNDDKEARYVLGVPGIFHNREKFMARMFGFENFKSIKRRDRRSGEFGYWYVPIILN